MKKILTLLLATGSFIAVNAQSSGTGNYPRKGRDVVLGGGGNNTGSYPSYPGSSSSGNSQYQIDQVNREYDAKINSIRSNPYLSNQEKDRSIRQLEKDRQRKIREINKSYKDGNYNDNRNGGRGNNGKHKGWYKKNKNKNWKQGNNDRDRDDD